MSNRYIYSCLLVLLSVNCRKSSLSTGEVLKNYTISAHSIPADGGSTIQLSVEMDNNTDADKRNVLFSASTGSYVGGKDSSISVKALFVDGKLIAKASFVAPIRPGRIYFSIQPDLNTPTNLRITDSVDALVSVAAGVRITMSSFGVLYGFLSEDTIVARLSNTSGGNVSAGARVVFEDVFTNGSSVGGRFRATAASSNAFSQTSTFYSPGFAAAPGSTIFLKVTVLDSQGQKTGIRDSVPITVITK
jgi:hypothetical protein